MHSLAYAVLAQGAQNTQEAPSGGVGAALIVGSFSDRGPRSWTQAI